MSAPLSCGKRNQVEAMELIAIPANKYKKTNIFNLRGICLYGLPSPAQHRGVFASSVGVKRP